MLLNTDCAEAEAVDGGIVVHLNSLTDHQKFVALLLELDIFVREAQPPRVVIDLSGSGFVQSRTLGEIARLANTAARAKTRLMLCSTNPLVQRVMTATELDKLVTVCESVTEAQDIWKIRELIQLPTNKVLKAVMAKVRRARAGLLPGGTACLETSSSLLPTANGNLKWNRFRGET